MATGRLAGGDSEKLVSLIILNYNGRDILDESLSCVERQSYRNVELIVVDNASTDGSAEYLSERMSSYRERGKTNGRLVVLADNRGFAGGNAEGLKVSGGEYIALLNTDAFPVESWLADLVAAMEADREIGICASRLVMRHDSEKIDSAGDGCVTSGHGIKRGNGEPASLYAQDDYVFGACAAAVLYRRAMIDDVGFLDEDFFINCEDTDLNFRSQLMGWKCRYVAAAVVRHDVSATIGRLSDLGVYHSARNDEYVWIKNVPLSLMIIYLPHKLIQWFGSFVYFCVKRGKWRAWLGGKVAALKMVAVLLRKRRTIQGRRRATDRYISSILTSILDRRMIGGKLRKLFSFRV